MNQPGPANTRVLVTGASGFVGRHVVSALLDQGYQVVAHSNKTKLPTELAQRCDRVVCGDIGDSSVQGEMLQDVQVVCHLAAYIPTQYIDLRDAERCHRVNAVATLELAQRACDAGVKRFIYYSTGNLYTPGTHACKETEPVFPSHYATDYMVSKLAAEIYLTNIARRMPLQVVIFRVATPYGPGEPGTKVIPTFLRKAAHGETLSLVNGGNMRLNFVYVEDVAALTAAALNSEHQGVFNVGSGESTSLRELADSVIALHKKHKPSLKLEPVTDNAFSGFAPIAIDAAKRVFRFSPRSLMNGLRDYSRFLKLGENL